VCLYQNRNGVLPLSVHDFSTTKGLAVVGPTAVDGTFLLGNYASAPDSGNGRPVGILEGIRKAFPPHSTGDESGDSGGLLYPGGTRFAAGCDNIACGDTSGFPEAVLAAKGANATILVLGTSPHTEDCTDTVACEGEGNDRTSIAFAGNQLKLAEALSAKNTNGAPLVCVLVHGAAMGPVAALFESCDAIVDAWYPGAQGGHAVADVVFGKVSPAGRSSVSWYTGDDALPAPGNMHMYDGAKKVTYRFQPQKGTGRGAVNAAAAAAATNVTIPFGFGLSFTTFAYSDLEVKRVASGGGGGAETVVRPPRSSAPGPGPLVIHPCDNVTVSVTVTNTGSVTSDEVVQVYTAQPLATVAAPTIRLADFHRVAAIPPGASRRVTALVVAPSWHAVIREQPGDWWGPHQEVEAGAFQIFVGGSQPKPYDQVGTVAAGGGGMMRGGHTRAPAQVLETTVEVVAGAGEKENTRECGFI
jgi:beta-glucosidase